MTSASPSAANSPLVAALHSRQITRKSQNLQQQHVPTSAIPKISVLSERPFVVRVVLTGGLLDQVCVSQQAGPPAATSRIAVKGDRQPPPRRVSARAPKRKRRNYAEDLEDTDSDVSDEEGEIIPETPVSKKRIKKRVQQGNGLSNEGKSSFAGEL